MTSTNKNSGKLPDSTPAFFNINVVTNVTKTFLMLIDKDFLIDKKLSKILNRNTIKVSNSCLTNVKQTISNNNNRLLQLHRMKESTQGSKLCNCRQESIDCKCLTKCVLYRETVTGTTSKTKKRNRTYRKRIQD